MEAPKCKFCGQRHWGMEHIGITTPAKGHSITTRSSPVMEQARHPDGTPKWIHHCLWCGKDFTGIFNKVFCSDGCRLNYWREDKKPHLITTKSEPLSWGKKRFKVFERDHFRCRYCGRGPMDNAILHVDHIYPKSKGGSDKMDNLITSCQECNFGKNSDILSHNPFVEFTTA